MSAGGLLKPILAPSASFRGCSPQCRHCSPCGSGLSIACQPAIFSSASLRPGMRHRLMASQLPPHRAQLLNAFQEQGRTDWTVQDFQRRVRASCEARSQAPKREQQPLLTTRGPAERIAGVREVRGLRRANLTFACAHSSSVGHTAFPRISERRIPAARHTLGDGGASVAVLARRPRPAALGAST